MSQQSRPPDLGFNPETMCFDEVSSPVARMHGTSNALANGISMPGYARYTKYGLMFCLALLAGICFFLMVSIPHWLPAIIGLFHILAIAGLFRTVAWGRTLTSWIFVPVVFVMSMGLQGDIDEPHGATALSHILGRTTPLWLDWLFIVLISSILLAPLVVIGWKRNYFRDEVW